MPQAVQKYIDGRDFEAVDEVKRDILSLYRNDIRKYADNQEIKVTAIYEEIPGQLQKHEKKFKLSALQDEARMRDYSEAFFIFSRCLDSLHSHSLQQHSVDILCAMNSTQQCLQYLNMFIGRTNAQVLTFE